MSFKFFDKLLEGNTLYFPGCLTKFARKDLLDKYRKFLEIEKIDYIMLSDKEFCCGSPLKNAGEKKVFEDLVRKNFEIFKAHGVRKIISNCPACCFMFENDYAKILGNEWNIEILHTTQLFKNSFSRINKNKTNKIKVSYHDPCHLGRGLGIYDLPREIIERAGYNLIEMDLNREMSFCCGAGAGVKNNEPELSKVIGLDRIDQAKKTKADILFTSCPMCLTQLQEVSKKTNIKALDLVDIFIN